MSPSSRPTRSRFWVVICGSGYRSGIEASLLLARGFARVQNVMGGMGAYQETKCAEWQAADLVFSPMI